MSHKEFDAEAREVSGEPITFGLGGVTFILRHPFPLGSIVPLSRIAGGGTTVTNLDRIRAVDRVLRAWITEDQHDAWDQVLRGLPDLNVLQQIVEWVIAEATGRPSEAPSSSPAS